MWVKICGVNQLADALTFQSLAKQGIRPDAIGLNFYPKSKRFVAPDIAAEIVKLLPPEVVPVGLFVNHSAEEIRTICTQCGLTTIQLHGDETPEFAAELREFQILKAFRVGPEGLDPVARQLERYQQIGVSLPRCLVDSQVPGSYGGTGHRAPWEQLRSGWSNDWPPLILAGGLNPQNVQEAIQATCAMGVDVASGVESSPGRQDPQLVEQFILEARTRSSN